MHTHTLSLGISNLNVLYWNDLYIVTSAAFELHVLQVSNKVSKTDSLSVQQLQYIIELKCCGGPDHQLQPIHECC